MRQIEERFFVCASRSFAQKAETRDASLRRTALVAPDSAIRRARSTPERILWIRRRSFGEGHFGNAIGILKGSNQPFASLFS